MITYWLQCGKEFVASVRAPTGIPDEDIRRMALDQHDRVPLNTPPDTPGDLRKKIERAIIKIYKGEG